MCPLLDQPNRGFADYQRESPFDTGILYTETVTGITFTQTPVIDVSRYAYLGGLDGCSGGDVWVTMIWSADKQGLVTTGERRFVLTGAMGKGTAQYRILNLGPFVQVSWQRIGAAATDHTVKLFATNRYHPVEFIPMDPNLFTIENRLIGAGVTDTFYPGTCYSGPVNVWFFAGGGSPWSCILQSLDASDVWDVIDQFGSVGAGGTRGTFVTPGGAWRMQVQNNTGVNSSYFLGVLPTLTGAT